MECQDYKKGCWQCLAKEYLAKHCFANKPKKVTKLLVPTPNTLKGVRSGVDKSPFYITD